MPRTTKTTRELPKSYPPVWDDFWYTPFAANGKVTAGTAERIASVYGCKKIITESVAMLPVSVFEETEENVKVKRPEHALFSLLRHSPNRYMDSFTFFQLMQSSLLDTGNAYAHVLRTTGGKILEIMPLIAEKVQIKVREDGVLVYIYKDGQNITRNYLQNEILHIRHDSKDGILGRSPITVAADTFGFASSLLDHGNALFENGAFNSGFIKAPFAFKDDERRRQFMDSFKEYFGKKNAGKVALLEQGVEFMPASMSNKDAQFLESKQFSVLEIARIFRVPPHMLQELSQGASYASIEQQSINFVTYTIQPWVTLWERAIKFQLLNSVGEEGYYVRFNVNAIIRSDLSSHVNAVKEQINYGLLTINEARALLDHNPVDDEAGDEPMVSHNLVPLSRVMEEPEPEEVPAPGDMPMPSQPVEPPDSNEPDDGNERFLPLVREIVGRILRREEKTIEKERERQENFKTWLPMWLEEHRTFVCESLEPLLQAVTGKSGKGPEYAARWICALENEIANPRTLSDAAEYRLYLLTEEVLHGK